MGLTAGWMLRGRSDSVHERPGTARAGACGGVHGVDEGHGKHPKTTM